MNPARFAATHWRAVLVMVTVLCAGGLFAATQIPTSIFPQTDFPRIVIIVDNGEVPATKMLVSVTRPIEESMRGIPGVLRVHSTTARGSVAINLFFDWKVDVVQTLQLVQARLSQLATSLPPTATVRQVERLTFAVFPVLGYSLTSDQRDPATLRDLASYTIKPRLAGLPGVAGVGIAGGAVREYHVQIDPELLAAHDVSLQQVSDAVKNSNVVASPGLIEENHQLELALVSGQAETPAELQDIVVATVDNAPVRLGQVATIAEGVAPNYVLVTADGRPAVLLNITRQPDANTVEVDEAVRAELETLQSQLPKDVRIAPFYDQSLLVRDSVRSVRDAILIGLLLSVAILYGFLRNWGTTLVAVVVIPVTMLATVLVMRLGGLSFDLMTLGGMAAAIGLVIDDAIVVVENIHSHLMGGQSRLEAISEATAEIAIPIIGSTITPVVVFLPLTLLSGVVGVFFRSLALTMAVALLTSLVLALTLTPALADKFIKTPTGAPPLENRPPVLNLLHLQLGLYERLLLMALRHPQVVLVIAAGTLVGSLLVYNNLGSEFLPSFDEGAFVLDYAAPPGASLSETNRMLNKVETLLRETPEVESYSRRTGVELGLTITEPNVGDFLVKLKSRHKRSTDDITNELRQKIESSEPSLRVEFLGILSDLIGDLTSSPAPVEIKLFSDNTQELHQKASEVAAAIKKVPGVVDIFNGVVVSGPAVTFKVNPLEAARFGVTATDIANAVTTAMTGDPASTMLQQGRLITVRVVLPPSAKSSLEVIRALPIRSAAGTLFRLDQVATVEFDPGQTEIEREGLRQMVAVRARLTGTNLGVAIAAIKKQLAGTVRFPPGMTIEYGGLYHEQEKSFRELVWVLILAVTLVFLVLLMEFRSFTHPVSILAGAVLALSGVLLALWLTHTTLNVVSLMGMIMVVGIVSKNGILLLDTVDDQVEQGKSLPQALLISGRRRFRPVLMTSLATMLGMLPLALAFGSGAELLQPLAIAVIGGLTVALLLSLVVTPTVHVLLAGIGSFRAGK
ncbi:MAG: efflux RND transporter permease subunit [Blastocatellia bacterium]|nr:efflux RND transporter permease subunit [Blastocatellia bacterium]